MAFRPGSQARNLVNTVLLRNLSPLRRKVGEQKRTVSGWFQRLLEQAMAHPGLEPSSILTSEDWGS